MSGVPEDANLVAVIPRRTADGDQRAGRIVLEIFEQRGHQRHGIGEFFFEKSAHILVGFRCSKTAFSFEFPKERARERPVRVWQRDHHETFARPDVECVLLHSPRTIRPRRNRQFLVAVGEITFVVLESANLALH